VPDARPRPRSGDTLVGLTLELGDLGRGCLTLALYLGRDSVGLGTSRSDTLLSRGLGSA